MGSAKKRSVYIGCAHTQIELNNIILIKKPIGLNDHPSTMTKTCRAAKYMHSIN